MITVSTDEICSSIKTIYENTRSIMEPAGALGVAGLKKYLAENKVRKKNLVTINSGANMNFDRLQFIAERTLTGEKKEALFAVTLPERPGALKWFCETMIGERNITEFNYRLVGRGGAHIFVGIGISNRKERESFAMQLKKNNVPNTDITDNELAKSHIRHMVGGRSFDTKNEVLYRFRFPERPKALGEFLGAMGKNWNISLFHYRMHGGDFGRVLVGLEIPKKEKKQFKAFLENLHYTYFEETENQAYRLFL